MFLLNKGNKWILPLLLCTLPCENWNSLILLIFHIASEVSLCELIYFTHAREWPNPVLLKQPEESNLNLPVWDPRVWEFTMEKGAFSRSLSLRIIPLLPTHLSYAAIALFFPLLCILMQVVWISNVDPKVISLKIAHIWQDKWIYQKQYHNPL